MEATIKINGLEFTGTDVCMRDVLHFLAENFNKYLCNNPVKYAVAMLDGIEHHIDGQIINWYLKSKTTDEVLQNIAREYAIQ